MERNDAPYRFTHVNPVEQYDASQKRLIDQATAQQDFDQKAARFQHKLDKDDAELHRYREKTQQTAELHPGLVQSGQLKNDTMVQNQAIAEESREPNLQAAGHKNRKAGMENDAERIKQDYIRHEAAFARVGSVPPDLQAAVADELARKADMANDYDMGDRLEELAEATPEQREQLLKGHTEYGESVYGLSRKPVKSKKEIEAELEADIGDPSGPLPKIVGRSNFVKDDGFEPLNGPANPTTKYTKISRAEEAKTIHKKLAINEQAIKKSNDSGSAISGSMVALEQYTDRSAGGTGYVATVGGLLKPLSAELETLNSIFNKQYVEYITKFVAETGAKSMDSNAEREALIAGIPDIKKDDKTNRSILIRGQMLGVRSNRYYRQLKAHMEAGGTVSNFESDAMSGTVVWDATAPLGTPPQLVSTKRYHELRKEDPTRYQGLEHITETWERGATDMDAEGKIYFITPGGGRIGSQPAAPAAVPNVPTNNDPDGIRGFL